MAGPTPPRKQDELLNFVTDLAGEQVLKVERELGGGYFKLNVTEAERRQARHDIRSIEDVVVEMVRNSRDAGASAVYIASGKESSGERHITIFDDGNGVPPDFHELIFEPRVTSKIDEVIEDRFGVHGRGMALYSIRSNTDELRLIGSEPGRGSVFSISVNVNRLGERKDQSSFPKMKVTGGTKIKIVSGPHNALRHLVELSIDTPELEIFYGTHTEILATLLAGGERTDGKGSPIWSELFSIDDAETLSGTGAAFGLKSSPRNCSRILSGGIEPVHSIQCLLRQMVTAAPAVKTAPRGRGGRISDEDLDGLAQAAATSFRTLGESYFLRLNGKPKITCSKTRITIELPIEADESW